MLRTICVGVNSDEEFQLLRTQLHRLPPADSRRFFGCRFDDFIDDINSFAMNLDHVLLMLLEKAPALQKMEFMFWFPVTPKILDVFASHMHPNITSFILKAGPGYV